MLFLNPQHNLELLLTPTSKSLILIVISTTYLIPPASSEFVDKSDAQTQLLPILYSEDSVVCFVEICEGDYKCPPRLEGYCPPDNITDPVLKDGQQKSLQTSKELIRQRIWWQYWHNIGAIILFVMSAIFLYYLGLQVAHLDPNLMHFKEFTDLALPYDGSFGFPLILYYKMRTRLDFDDDFVDVWRKQSLEQAPVTDTTGWHDHSETPSAILNERRRKIRTHKMKKMKEDEKAGVLWIVRQPSAVRHPNFAADNARLQEYLRVRGRFKLERKHMKRALLEHDVALARRIQAGMRLMAKHNEMALTKKLEELERKVGRLRQIGRAKEHRHALK